MLIILFMAMFAHAAVLTTASAGGSALFFIFDYFYNYQCNDDCKDNQNSYRSEIINKPIEHIFPPLINNYLILTSFVSFVASLYGLKSIKRMNARTMTAAIVPMMLIFPLSAEPNWKIIREIA